jgi:hypothetical protein
VPSETATVIALVAGVCLLQAIWYLRFRSGSIMDLDEAAFIARALSDTHSLGDGPDELVRTVMGTGVVGPFVPFTTIPLLLVFGDSLGAAWAMTGVYLAILLVATYAVGRRLLPTPWAALAAFLVGTAPVVTDYSRIYHFGVPAAALMTCAVWCLMRADRLRDRRFVVAAGVLVGCMLLTRTMTAAFLPGVAIELGAQVLATAERRERNFAVFWVAAAVVALPWWVANARAAGSHLLGVGYGSDAVRFGASHRVLSFDFWLKELRLIGDYLFAPLMLVVLACFACAAVVLVTRRPRIDVRAWAQSDAFLLAVLVVMGYLALTSTSVEGSGYPLPWLPALIILTLAGARAVPLRAVRAALAGALVLAGLFNVLVKNGVATELSRPTSARLPILSETDVKDGRDRIYQMLDESRYPVPPPPEALPAMHREWMPLNRRLVEFMKRYAEERGQIPRVLVGTGDWMLYDSRLYLASELWTDRGLSVSSFSGSTIDGYVDQIRQAVTNTVMIADPPRVEISGLNGLAIVAAMQRLGFRPVHMERAPDNRRVTLWWHGER